MLVTAAKADLAMGRGRWRDPGVLGRYWDGPGEAPTEGEVRHAHGTGCGTAGLASCRRVLGSMVFPWTGDFWDGLRDSGALRRGDKCWRVRAGRLPELLEDLEASPAVQRVGVEDDRGRRKVRSSSMGLPGSGVHCPGWLAGFLSGCGLREWRGEWVLAGWGVTERGRRWLSEAGVLHGPMGAGGVGVAVSPFYLPLVWHLCPWASGARWVRVSRCRPGRVMGDLMLPLATWDLCFGKGPMWPSKSWGLPFCVSNRTRWLEGIDREGVHRWAVGAGVASPARWLVGLCREWREGWEARG